MIQCVWELFFYFSLTFVYQNFAAQERGTAINNCKYFLFGFQLICFRVDFEQKKFDEESKSDKPIPPQLKSNIRGDDYLKARLKWEEEAKSEIDNG